MRARVIVLLFITLNRSAQISIRRNNILVDNNNNNDNNSGDSNSKNGSFDQTTTTNNSNNNKADDEWIFDNNDENDNNNDNNADKDPNSEDYGIEVVNTTIELLNSTHSNTLRVKIGASPTDASNGDAITHYDWPAVRELSDHFAAVDAPTALSVGLLLARLKTVAYERAYGGAAARNHFGHDGNGGDIKAAGIKVPVGSTQSIAPFLFEGDIILSETQAASILAHVSGDRPTAAAATGRRPTRSLSSDEDAIWTGQQIRYRFHDSLEFFAISQILEAIRFWEASTCLRFKHVRDRLVDGEDHLEFFKGQGCYSMIGRKSGRQGISIGVGCERIGIIEHEIGHALGLWHEQSRPDAPNYVDVRKEFIIPLYISDFQRRGADEILTLGVPYDYGSVMHYGPTAFSADGFSHTLVTTNPFYQATIGQREQLSFYDVQIINNAYCSNKCVSGRTTCRNGGYPNPTNCSHCLCPSGYGNDDCVGHQPPKNAVCGGVIRVGFAEWHSIRSPGYEADGYEEDQRCSWVVQAPAGARVLAVFADDFALLCSSICQDFVELKLARDQCTTGARFCCDKKPDEQFISESNQMAVIFRSQASQDRGFHLRLRATNQTHYVITAAPPTTTVAATTLAGANIWAEWGPWSPCSRSCGGCGIRSRARACLTAECENKSQEFSACNFDACPVSENCQRLYFFNHVCGRRNDPPVSGRSHGRGSGSAPSVVCSDLSSRLADCGQPSCCPPFYVHNGRCVGEQSDTSATQIIGELRRRVAALAAPTLAVGRGRFQKQY